MKMRSLRRKMNFMFQRRGVWIDHNGKHGPDIRGSTYTTRLVRLKHYKRGYGLGKNNAYTPLLKLRGVPINYKEIAKENGFIPLERYSNVWAVMDCEVGYRLHELHRSKSRAWLACYREAVETLADKW